MEDLTDLELLFTSVNASLHVTTHELNVRRIFKAVNTPTVLTWIFLCKHNLLKASIEMKTIE